MKKKTKIIISLAVACAGTLVLAACGSGSPYGDLAKKGYNVKLTFDANGGIFTGREGVEVVNTFKYTDIENGGVRLIAPNDKAALGDSSSSIANVGYFLAGWYKTKTPRTNEQGQPLDAYGNVTTEENQSYIYSGRWDFDSKQKLTVNDLTAEEDGTYSVTLHAAWVPEFEYHIMKQEGTEWVQVASVNYNPMDAAMSERYERIAIPQWNEETGAMDYGNFPKADNLTFENVYATKDKSEALTEISHSGEVNFENGTGSNFFSEYYADYREGVWYRIHTAAQLNSNWRSNGCYEIYEDLDFEHAVWAAGRTTGSFSGTIIGMDGVKKLSNITTVNSNTTDTVAGGVFGSIDDGARIENINFENVSFTVKSGSSKANAQFGLFAGDLSGKAIIENVTVSGKFIIGAELARFSTTQLDKQIFAQIVGSENDEAFNTELDDKYSVIAVEFGGDSVEAEKGENGLIIVKPKSKN